MKFAATEYNLEKVKIIDRIKSTHNWEEDEGFIADGVICPKTYEKQSYKILAILAESYGYQHNQCVDIELQPEKDILGLTNPKVKTPRSLSIMLHLLTHSLERGEKITSEEWKNMPYLLRIRKAHTATLQTTLSKIAWVNVKKASNPNSKMDRQLVRSHANQNKDILRDQISSIQPDLIILCGEAVSSSMTELKIAPPSCSRGNRWVIQNCGGVNYIEVTHPRSSDWMGYGGIYDIYETIYDQIVTLQTA